MKVFIVLLSDKSIWHQHNNSPTSDQTHTPSSIELSYREVHINSLLKLEWTGPPLTLQRFEKVNNCLDPGGIGFYISGSQILQQALFSLTLWEEAEHRVCQWHRHKPVTFQFS